jgi:hypothetical protein
MTIEEALADGTVDKLVKSWLRRCGRTDAARAAFLQYHDLRNEMAIYVMRNLPKYDPKRGSVMAFLRKAAHALLDELATNGRSATTLTRREVRRRGPFYDDRSKRKIED